MKAGNVRGEPISGVDVKRAARREEFQGGGWKVYRIRKNFSGVGLESFSNSKDFLVLVPPSRIPAGNPI